MKLIGLNCWGGHEFEPLMEFVEAHKDSTDIFCFQEIFKTDSDKKNYKEGRVNLLEELSKVLDNFSYSFTPMLKGFLYDEERVDFDLEGGIAVFYRKSLNLELVAGKKVLSHSIPIDREGEQSCSIQLQIIDFRIAGKKDLTIINTHGITYPVDKLDSDERILQSRTIINVLKEKNGEIIVTGDFNLLPETSSIKILGDVLRNLISEFNIENTRSVLTNYRGKPGEQKFADYTFVSEGIKVKSFEVPDLNVSDHLPMILEFEF